jgi:hypothetical protein
MFISIMNTFKLITFCLAFSLCQYFAGHESSMKIQWLGTTCVFLSVNHTQFSPFVHDDKYLNH